MLATIIGTTGSTPAAALSKMLVRQGGIISVGTVGGGCMEGDVIRHAARLYDSGKAEIVSFELSEDDIEHGLICGGGLDVLVEPITQEHISLIRKLKLLRDQGEDCAVATFINKDGTVLLKEFLNSAPSGWEGTQAAALAQQPEKPELLQTLIDSIAKVFRHQETVRLPIAEGTLILEPAPGTPSLVIFGGGHVSKYLSKISSMAGFRVTIVDDREKFANETRFPEASQTLAADFEQAFGKISISGSTSLVIVTRGHRYDELVLERALGTPASYIGMIGSKRKVATAFAHLSEKGVPPEALGRVHAPIGLDIGAVTAEEIAVSIVAELIHARRDGGPVRHKSEELRNS